MKIHKNETRIHVLSTNNVNVLERYKAGVKNDTEKPAASW